GALHRSIEAVWTGTRFAEDAILPENVAIRVHQNDPVIGRAIRSLRDNTGRRARACHQSVLAHSPSIGATDNRIGGKIVRAQSELPDYVTRHRIRLNDSIVELVGDEDVA